jgi:hypothetical protein
MNAFEEAREERFKEIARPIGVQEGVNGERIELFNLNEAIIGHPKGSTVSRATIEEHLRQTFTEGARSYRIIRHYFRSDHRTIRTGLTLWEARKHCNDPETSSNRCTSAAGRRRTRRMGAWFDGYTAK